MSITVEKKAELIKEFGKDATDTGSPEVQIAILTHRILSITEHMKANHKDYHTRRGLLMLVGRRRGLLDYLKKKDEARYQTVIGKLNIRR